MRRRISIIAVLTVLLAGVALTPPSQAAPAPSHIAVERLDGLAPAEMTGGGRFQGQSAGGDAATLSEQAHAPLTFSMVGFHMPAGVEVQFRSSTDGVQWSDWVPVEPDVDEGPDPRSAEADSWPGDGRTFSVPVWVGDRQFIQTRVEGGSPSDVAVELIDATGANRSIAQQTVDAVRAAFSAAGTPAVASPGQPPIVTRAEWGANESWRRGSPSYASRVRFGVVHHTAGTNSYTEAEAPAVVRGVYAYHVKSRGWSDIGYQFLVDKFGTIYEGRYGGMDKGVIGAHAGGFNTGSFGASLMGDYTATPPTAAQFESLSDLFAWKFELHHIDPLGVTQQTSGGSSRYSAGTVVKLNNVSGHRDMSSTTCPAGGYSLLPPLRTEIVERSGPVIVSHDASTTHVRLGQDRSGPAVSFSAQLRPEGDWTVNVRDPDGDVVFTDTGRGSHVASTWTPTDVQDVGRFSWSIESPGRRSPVASLDVIVDLVERVGDGASVTEMLIGIARTAFPEPGSAEHAVVARDDVFADALGGGPLAGTKGPVLFTPSTSLQPETREELERVLPPGRTVYVLGGTAAIAPAVEQDLAKTWKVVRLGGPTRYETAIEIAEVVRNVHGGSTVMVARSGPDNSAPWADALAGGAWGAQAGVPVVLTPPDRLNDQTRAALADWGITRSIVLGGTDAISEAAAAPLPGGTRVAGSDRAGTAAEIAGRLWGRTDAEPGARLALADGYRDDAWKPALAASPLAARHDAPLLLTRPDVLSDNAADYLSGLGYDPANLGRAYAIGTPWRISQRVADSASLLLQ